MIFTILRSSMRIGSPQSRKNKSRFDEYSTLSTARAKMPAISEGRKRSQTVSEASAERNTGETIAALHASRGEVRDNTCEMHPSGNVLKSTPAISFSPAIPTLSLPLALDLYIDRKQEKEMRRTRGLKSYI